MQQLLLCACILLVSFIVYYLLGKAVCVRYGWDRVMPEVICIGFFLYYALFQVFALIMIFSKQKLHVLGSTWLVILILLIGMSASVVFKGRAPESDGQGRLAGTARVLFGIMVFAVICECIAAVLLQRNIGWDFAYYIGNMTTSVATDTMYLYDGSSGLLRSKIDMRYALSSFYMNTAWISQMTGISALVLQKYAVGTACILLTNAIAYSFAMEVFGRDKGKAAVLVTITIIMAIFWDVYDTSAQFLMLRNYEAKAYCANVVLPMVLYLLYRIWKDDAALCNWAELFIVALASVAVSMSSLMLVPALTVIMLLAHLFVAGRFNAAFIRRAVYCLLPNVCYFLVYFSYTRGWLVVEV